MPAVKQLTGSPGAVEIIWESAVEAAGGAFVVWILGGVALSIAGAFAGDMIPSAPPFHRGGVHPWFGQHWLHSLKGHSLVFLFAAFFAHSLWIGFRARRGVEVGALKRLEYMLLKLRKDWFRMIVGNAIGAWVGAVILVWASGFSLTQIVWHWLMGLIFSAVHGLGGATLGDGRWSRIEEWFDWYGANQMKLNFWFLYIAGICDDLGLPNFKALLRWLWRRWKRRDAPASPTEIKDVAVAERGDKMTE